MKGDNVLNYSFKLNFNDKYYAFYDWLNTDDIKEYHHIKYYKVDTKTLNDLINYVVKVKDTIDDTVYMYSNTFSYIAIIYKDNISFKISSVMLNDEYKLKKIYLDLKYTKIDYIKESKRLRSEDLRYMDVLKDALLKEVNLLNDEDKMKYLYYEWFDRKESNIALIKKRMLSKLQKPLTKKEKYIYELIMASKK